MNLSSYFLSIETGEAIRASVMYFAIGTEGSLRPDGIGKRYIVVPIDEEAGVDVVNALGIIR